MCVCVCVCVRARACVHVCMCACVRTCACTHQTHVHVSEVRDCMHIYMSEPASVGLRIYADQLLAPCKCYFPLYCLFAQNKYMHSLVLSVWMLYKEHIQYVLHCTVLCSFVYFVKI